MTKKWKGIFPIQESYKKVLFQYECDNMNVSPDRKINSYGFTYILCGNSIK
jgi:hypothetical protein